MTFSERLGFREFSEIIQKDSISEPLQNRIFNLVYDSFSNLDASRQASFYQLYKLIMTEYYKKAYSDILDSEYYADVYFNEIKEQILIRPWYEIYDFLEFLLRFEELILTKQDSKKLNKILNEEKSAYRLSDSRIFIPIIDDLSLTTIDTSLNSNGSFQHAQEHLLKSVQLLGLKKATDYNSIIRKSIDAVESCFIEVSKLDPGKKNTLGSAVKEIKKIYPTLNMDFFKPFEQLYGFASNNGIRHPGNEKTIESDLADTILVLTTCSAMLNYLSVKINE